MYRKVPAARLRARIWSASGAPRGELSAYRPRLTAAGPAGPDAARRLAAHLRVSLSLLNCSRAKGTCPARTCRSTASYAMLRPPFALRAPGRTALRSPWRSSGPLGRFQIISHAMASLCEPRSLPSRGDACPPAAQSLLAALCLPEIPRIGPPRQPPVLRKGHPRRCCDESRFRGRRCS